VDDVMMVRAGNRGQPDWWVDYKHIVGFTTNPGAEPSEVDVVLRLSRQEVDTRASWGDLFVIRGVLSSEAEGLRAFLVDRGAQLGGS
jgi:hypothetical protein